MTNNSFNISVFASGAGSNFISIHKACLEQRLVSKLSCLITDNSKAKALEYANENKIPALCISKSNFPDKNLRTLATLNFLKEHNVNFIFLLGYLKLIPSEVVNLVHGNIINTHPSLLPKFGGKGMYGMNVHQAVIAAKEKTSGITIHKVNEHYDDGAILNQKVIPIFENETAETLANKIKPIENQFVVDTLIEIEKGNFKSISSVLS